MLPELKFYPALKSKKKKTRLISIFAISILDTFKTISKMRADRNMEFSHILAIFGYSRKLAVCFNVHFQKNVVIQEIVHHSYLPKHSLLKMALGNIRYIDK